MNSCSFTGGTGSLALTDFNLNLTTQLMDDKYRYLTSASVVSNDFVSKDCSFQYTTIWDATLDNTMNAGLGNLISAYTLTLNNSSKHWAIVLSGKL
jgi:hypothetical protein